MQETFTYKELKERAANGDKPALAFFARVEANNKKREGAKPVQEFKKLPNKAKKIFRLIKDEILVNHPEAYIFATGSWVRGYGRFEETEVKVTVKSPTTKAKSTAVGKIKASDYDVLMFAKSPPTKDTKERLDNLGVKVDIQYIPSIHYAKALLID